MAVPAYRKKINKQNARRAAQGVARNVKLRIRFGSRKPATYSNRGRYSTTGVYRGRFKRGSTVTLSQTAKYGAAMRTEKGGIVDQDKCVYIGHSTCASEKVLRIVFHALVRKIYRKAGMDFESFKEPVGRMTNRPAFPIGEIKMYYIGDAGSDLSEHVHVITQDQTYEAVADDLLADVKGVYAASSTQKPTYKYLEFYPYIQGGAVTAIAPTVKVKLENVFCMVKVSSELTLQNRTLAATAGSSDRHDVENNPVEGYSYMGSYNGMRLRYQDKPGGSGNHPAMLANVNDGHIELDPDDSNLTANEQDMLQRPPLAHALLHSKRSAKQRIGPGILRRSKLFVTKKMSFNQVLRTFRGYLNGGSGFSQITYFGNNRIFAFEKMMHTSAGDEPNINIGWEVNNLYQAYCFEKGSLCIMDKDVL